VRTATGGLALATGRLAVDGVGGARAEGEEGFAIAGCSVGLLGKVGALGGLSGALALCDALEKALTEGGELGVLAFTVLLMSEEHLFGRFCLMRTTLAVAHNTCAHFAAVRVLGGARRSAARFYQRSALARLHSPFKRSSALTGSIPLVKREIQTPYNVYSC